MAANIKPLKMCINITIPSVEDSDLSLYEAMCTLAGKLQDTIKEINEILADVVVTVNGKEGPNVVIKGSDISVSDTNSQSIDGALSQKYSAENPPPYPVTSVNNKTGAVTLSAGDINTTANKTVEQVLQENTIDIARAVITVNGKKGPNVELKGSDISVSDTDDQSINGALTQKYSADNPPPYPVTSVNAKTGAVEIKGDEISVSSSDDQSIAGVLSQKLAFTGQPYTSWISVRNQPCGVYRTSGFIPWSDSMTDNGLLFILGNTQTNSAYIFIRNSVPDTLYFGIGNPSSSADWYLIHGQPVSG